MRRLVILLLMAWLSSIHSNSLSKTSCPYHYIKESKSFNEAKRYCKEKYTDLATITEIPGCVRDKVEEKCVWVSSHVCDGGKGGNSNGQSHSSSSSSEESNAGDQCQAICNQGGDLTQYSNDKPKPFFCYMDEKAPPLILIRENKTWAEALDYCRENYNDLVSVYDASIQEWVAEKAKLADSPYVWLGMRYTCTMGFWFWVDGRQPCYENWAEGKGNGDCEMSGAMESAGDSRWFSLSDAQRLNFICSFDIDDD